MNFSERITVVSSRGNSITGRIVNPVTKKLGNYEVFSEHYHTPHIPYASYAEAEKVYKKLLADSERDKHD